MYNILLKQSLKLYYQSLIKSLKFKIVNKLYNHLLIDKRQSGHKAKQMKSTSVLDSFLKQIKRSNYYCQAISIDLRFQTLEDISIKPPQNRELEFIAKLPEIKFSFTQEIVNKLSQDIAKTKKTRNGIIAAYQNLKFKHKMQKIMYFVQNDEEDIGVWQQTQDAFCVGFIVQKQANYENFRKRLTTQLKKCLQKKLQKVIYQKKTQSQDSFSSLNPIQKIMYKHFRFFLVYEPMSNSSLLVNRIMYYPDAKFLIKPIKLVPAKFTANKVYEEVLSFKNKFDYGYLSLSNTTSKERRFLLIDKLDPELNQSPPPMIGVWMSAEKFQSKEEMKNYAWALIMEYIRNPSLRIKLSINFQNSGLLFTIERPQKITAYMFQIIQQPKWSLKYSPENTFKIPEEYVFNDQEVIVEEDKEESDIESIQNRSIMKNNNSFNNYFPDGSYPTSSNLVPGGGSSGIDISKSSFENKSVKSNQDKETQIRCLKTQLQFYKNRCEMLQKMLNNPAIMQLQAMQQSMQMLNPLANSMINPMGFNNPMIYSPIQANGLPNPQMNFMPQMINPSINMINPQNNILSTSRASSTANQKILNESELCQEEMEPAPEPVPIKNDLAFNKKKTFQQERQTTNFELDKSNMKKKQSLPVNLTSQKSTQKTNNNILNQFPSEQDIQMSPNAKKHYFEYDYKNISFAQQNSFDNQLNSTHKFASFEANQSQILGKSPDFKKSFNSNGNNLDKENDSKVQSFQNKKQNLNNYKDFSFDKKDEEFLSSKNSRPSPQKVMTKFFQQDQEAGNVSQDSDKGEKNIISKLQMKYRNQYSGNKDNQQKKYLSKKDLVEESPIAKQKAIIGEKFPTKQKDALKEQRGSPNYVSKYETQKDIPQQRINRSKAFEGSLGIDSKRSQQKGQELQRKYTSTQAINNKYESITPKKPIQKQVKKQKQSPGNRNSKNPIQSKVKQVQNSDSDSDDQELKNISQKYKGKTLDKA